MALRVSMSNDDPALDEVDLDLPDLGTEADDGEGLEETSPHDLTLADVGDPFDDRPADDLPLEVEIDASFEGPSAVGDDSEGLPSAGDDEIALDEQESSLLDDRGHAEEGIDFSGDDELGIDPIPHEVDDGGIEGLDDPAESAAAVDFPPLDGAEDDDEEIDVGLELPPEGLPREPPA